LPDELVEESVLAVVRGPDGHIEGPGDAALSGFPEGFGIGVFGEFVEADVAAIDSHGLRVGRKGADGGTIFEFNEADFDVIHEAGGAAVVIEARDFQVIFAVSDDGAGVIVELGEFVTEADIFEGAGVIFGGEKVIAFFEAETFAHVFKGVGVGPADTDGLFSQGEGLEAFSVDRVFSLDPVDLVRHEAFCEHGVGIDFEGGEDGAHC